MIIYQSSHNYVDIELSLSVILIHPTNIIYRNVGAGSFPLAAPMWSPSILGKPSAVLY